MNQEILQRLLPVTAEEEEILRGEKLNRSRYSEGDGRVVNAERLLEKGKLITLRTHTRFVHFPEHTHDYVEMVYMLQGETHHRINGKDMILRAGEMLFLGQSARQEIFPAGEGDLAVNFIILPAFFYQTLEMLGAEDTPVKGFLIDALFGKGNAGYLHFCVSGVLPVENLVENLLWNLLSDPPNKQSLARTTMGLLFMQLMGCVDKLSAPTPEEALLSELYRYIEENYRLGSLSEAAKKLHVDLFHLSRFLRRATGKTYTRLVQEKRLSQAVYLLKNTALSVEEISLLVGYENKSYFYRLFTARFGLSPKAYRTCHRP